eukprot:11178620-Lingulodinium_polyedra.AAC.2
MPRWGAVPLALAPGRWLRATPVPQLTPAHLACATGVRRPHPRRLLPTPAARRGLPPEGLRGRPAEAAQRPRLRSLLLLSPPLPVSPRPMARRHPAPCGRLGPTATPWPPNSPVVGAAGSGLGAGPEVQGAIDPGHPADRAALFRGRRCCHQGAGRARRMGRRLLPGRTPRDTHAPELRQRDARILLHVYLGVQLHLPHASLDAAGLVAGREVPPQASAQRRRGAHLDERVADRDLCLGCARRLTSSGRRLLVRLHPCWPRRALRRKGVCCKGRGVPGGGCSRHVPRGALQRASSPALARRGLRGSCRVRGPCGRACPVLGAAVTARER